VDEDDPYALRPIGVVRSTLSSPTEAPNQAFEGAPAATLEIEPRFADALHGIRVGDELILLTWLNLANRDVLQTHPTGDTNIPLTGVFRTRSPDRPNPIGVHRVTVTARERAHNSACRCTRSDRRHADHRPQGRNARGARSISANDREAPAATPVS
jgi:tRNA-Thr(GGU) m(6)t(6)A37 methyltransferase TsaA